jgi:RNA polymerase-binding transcription factor DksA
VASVVTLARSQSERGSPSGEEAKPAADHGADEVEPQLVDEVRLQQRLDDARLDAHLERIKNDATGDR